MIDKLLNKCEEGTQFIGEYKNSKTSVTLMCKHGHTRTVIPSNLMSRGSCASCHECAGINKYNKKTTSKAISELPEGIELIGEYLGALTRHNFKCINGHYFKEYPTRVEKCKECSPSIDPRTKNNFAEELAVYNLELVSQYINSRTTCTVRCTKGHEYEVLPSNYTSYGTGSICRVCNPIISYKEKELLNFIKSIYKGWIVEQDKTILNGLELDIILPDVGLAIEFNGTYWHSTVFKDKNYHATKTKLTSEFGYRLIQVAEHEWDLKRDIVKSRIRSSLGITTRVFARKCSITKIDFPKEFLEENHIQGSGGASSINYGLFLYDELVAVMTFSKPRFNCSYDYELVRYCSLADITVVGGASRLLKQFRKDYSGSIISYSDKRWSSGNLYKTLGFEYSHSSDPGYFYVKGKDIISRYKCQKHKLKDLLPKYYAEHLSETEIMTSAGYYKVYDCGNDVWISR